jgi:hypothetical protein
MSTPDLGQLAEAVSALVAVVALIQSYRAKGAADDANRELAPLKQQMQAVQTQLAAQRQIVNVAITTAPNAQTNVVLPPEAQPGTPPETAGD